MLFEATVLRCVERRVQNERRAEPHVAQGRSLFEWRQECADRKPLVAVPCIGIRRSGRARKQPERLELKKVSGVRITPAAHMTSYGNYLKLDILVY